MLKENLGLKPHPIGFRIHSQGLEFGVAPETPRRETAKDQAEDWLRANMQPGKKYKASEIQAEAEQHGHSKRTLRKAATERLHIIPEQVRKDGKIAEFMWKLPKG